MRSSESAINRQCRNKCSHSSRNRHCTALDVAGLRERCEASKHLLAKGPGFVLYALMDFVVDQYFPILRGIRRESG